jgi:hypothetical protein
MKIYTHATPSHYPLLDLLKASMKRIGLKPPLVSLSSEQADDGEYFAPGWDRAMASKIQTVLNAINSGAHKEFLFVDADVVFIQDPFPPLRGFLDSRGWDVAFARDDDERNACPGMALIRQGSVKVRKLYRNVMLDLQHGRTPCEQPGINAYLRSERDIRWGFLPDTFANPMIVGDRPLNECVAYHANWTIGVEAKRKRMEWVLEEIAK